MSNDTLDAMLQRWKTELECALLHAENNARAERHLPALPTTTKVWIPSTRCALLALINLRVWCVRYAVPLDFILRTLLYRYRTIRTTQRTTTDVHLGIPTAVLCGQRSRNAVEEAVLRTFPADENHRACRQVPPPPPPTLQFDTNGHDPIQAMLHEYTRIMSRRQRHIERTPQPVRAYRRVG